MSLDWHLDPLSTMVLALLAWAYVRGSRRLPETAHPQRKRLAISFWCGSVALALAFGPPLHGLTEISFAAHMAQHEILMLIAAPLFVLARPQGVLMWGLPRVLMSLARGITRSPATRAVLAVLVTPLVAFLLHLAVLWGWHVPGAFDTAVGNEAMHWLQHLSFFIAALIFWYSVIAPGRAPQHSAPAVMSLFATAMHTGVLGVLLTFSSAPWYRAYLETSAISGLSPLEDQQLGGLIMWVPGGVVFVLAALALLALWLTAPDRGAWTERRVT